MLVLAGPAIKRVKCTLYICTLGVRPLGILNFKNSHLRYWDNGFLACCVPLSSLPNFVYFPEGKSVSFLLLSLLHITCTIISYFHLNRHRITLRLYSTSIQTPTHNIILRKQIHFSQLVKTRTKLPYIHLYPLIAVKLSL